jgi:hypothetical protein
MGSSRNYHLERAQAKAVIHVAWKNFGNRAFRVDPHGKHIGPLRLAEQRGWCWFPGTNRCALTPAGVQELADFGAGND